MKSVLFDHFPNTWYACM